LTVGKGMMHRHL